MSDAVEIECSRCSGKTFHLDKWRDVLYAICTCCGRRIEIVMS